MPSDRRFHRGVWLVLAACGVLIALEFGVNLRVALDDPRNDARLAATAALLRGVPLWSPAGTGPLVDMVYGPVAALAWIPAAAQSTPTRAIATGLLQATLLILLPVAWIIHTEARRHLTLFASALLLGAAYLLSTPVLPAFGLRPDVPALAFATLAMACAWTEGRRQHAGWRWAGAAAVVASVGTKQVMVPLLVAYPAWIALVSGRRAAGRSLGAIVVVGAVSLVLVILTVDVEAMLFATVVGPSRQPWVRSDAAEALAWAAGDLVRRGMPAALLLGLAAILLRRGTGRWGTVARSNRWLFPLALGLACIPTALLGRAKVGGSPNNLAFSIWFLWIAMLAAYASAGRRRPAVRRTLTAIALLAACALALRVAPRLRLLPSLVGQRPVPSTAFDAARRSPGTIYFPHRPLVGIMSDGRVDHSASGIYFWRLSDSTKMDSDYVRAFLPPALDRVAEDRDDFPYVLNFLPHFRRQVHDPSLPGWIVLMVDDRLAAGEAPAPVELEYRAWTGTPTEVLNAPDSPVQLQSARVILPERRLRYVIRLEAVVRQTVPHTDLEVEVILRDRSSRHLLTLAARASPDASGALVAEWPVFDEVVWATERTIALVRGGQPAGGGDRWFVSPEELGPLMLRAPLAITP